MGQKKMNYTAAEVGEIYQVPYNTVLCWIRAGKLNAVRIGREYRVRQKDLEEMEARYEAQKPANKTTYDEVQRLLEKCEIDEDDLIRVLNQMKGFRRKVGEP